MKQESGRCSNIGFLSECPRARPSFWQLAQVGVLQASNDLERDTSDSSLDLNDMICELHTASAPLAAHLQHRLAAPLLLSYASLGGHRCQPRPFAIALACRALSLCPPPTALSRPLSLYTHTTFPTRTTNEPPHALTRTATRRVAHAHGALAGAPRPCIAPRSSWSVSTFVSIESSKVWRRGSAITKRVMETPQGGARAETSRVFRRTS